MHFCWLPPERLVTGTSPPAVLIASSLIDQATARRSARGSIKRAEGQLGEAADRDVLGHGHAVEEAQGLAVLGHHGDPGRDRLVGMCEPDRPALEPDRPGRRRRAGAEDRFEQLGSAGPEQPGDAQDLAGADRET